MYRLFVSLLAGVLIAGSTSFAFADELDDCERALDLDVRIKACTDVIETLKRGTWTGDADFPPLIHLMRGEAWIIKGEHDKALADIEHGISLAPHIPDGYGLRARVHAERGENTLALVYANKAIELAKPPYKESSVDYYMRGGIYEKTGNMQSARADYEKALQIEPSHTGAKEGLARLEQERAARNPKGLPECKDGETVSFKAKIVQVFPPSRTTQQTQLDLDNFERGCILDMVFFKGINAPKACVVGAMIEATGVVDAEDGPVVYEPKNVNCK